jgi:His-Xaa-Ser system radical SAM maturase HxsC
LLQLQPAVLLAPAVVGLFGDFGFAAGLRGSLWLAIATSICRKIATICSGVCFFLAILQLLSYQILSHFLWYKIRRSRHPHNTLFATERCNSNCLMCSQPPIDKDDMKALTERNLKLIDLLSPAPEYLCITGGEPTLLGERLLTILNKLRDVLPSTYVHILTNGRRFAWAEFTSNFAEVGHPSLSVGIPLYADHAELHDYVVQARDAFDQTVLGLHQLARYGIETEIRVVLHALTVPRLTHLAEYICRNLTFVDHVAFMGMEHIGYAPRNMGELWIDPVDYQEELESGVTILARFGIDVRIYNLQLCVLKQSLWKYSKQSISDWKKAYREVCKDCAVRERCGGFFHWDTKAVSRGIHCVPDASPELRNSFMGMRKD